MDNIWTPSRAGPHMRPRGAALYSRVIRPNGPRTPDAERAAVARRRAGWRPCRGWTRILAELMERRKP